MQPVKSRIVGGTIVTALLVMMVPNGLIGGPPDSTGPQDPGGISPLVGAPDPRGDLPNCGPTPEGIIVDVFTDGPARGAKDWARLEQMLQSLTGALIFKRPW